MVKYSKLLILFLGFGFSINNNNVKAAAAAADVPAVLAVATAEDILYMDAVKKRKEHNRVLYNKYLARCELKKEKVNSALLLGTTRGIPGMIASYAGFDPLSYEEWEEKSERVVSDLIFAKIEYLELKELLESGDLDPNFLYQGNTTPLLCVIQSRFQKLNPTLEFMELLLINGANPNFKTKYQQSALMSILECDNRSSKSIIKMLRLLLKYGADVNIKKNGNPALIFAIGNKSSDLIKVFLNHKDIDVNAKDRNNITALMYAAHYGIIEIVHSLLKQNADVYAVDVYGHTALTLAQRAIREVDPNQKGGPQRLSAYATIIELLENYKGVVRMRKGNNISKTALAYMHSLAKGREALAMLKRSFKDY